MIRFLIFIAGLVLVVAVAGLIIDAADGAMARAQCSRDFAKGRIGSATAPLSENTDLGSK